MQRLENVSHNVLNRWFDDVMADKNIPTDDKVRIAEPIGKVKRQLEVCIEILKQIEPKEGEE